MSVDAARLVTEARNLLQRPDAMTDGIWPRATAFLTRQALELTLDDLWRRRAPGVQQCSARAQLLCLPTYLRGDENLAKRASYAWGGLSRACHQHAYELSPAASELQGWIETVEELTNRVQSS